MEPHHHRRHYPRDARDEEVEDEEPLFRRFLDATGDREVVFCYRCAAQWYNDEYGLVCPACECEATQIVTAEDDPRDSQEEDDDFASMFSQRPDVQMHPDQVSDPEEDNIEDYHTFSARRGIWDGSQNRPVPDPGADDILRHFYDLLSNIAGGPPGFGHIPPPGAQAPHPHSRTTATTTFTQFGNNGVSTRVIFTGPSHMGHPGGPPQPFPGFFSSYLSDVGPPPVPRSERPQGLAGGPPSIAASLAEIINMMSHPGRTGDAVYSQEALDRIITSLMEQNPQSNAAPPATEAALEQLDRRQVDDDMLRAEGGTAECTICIEDLEKGDTVIVLPCKHWFHDHCAVLWLKEHNTCPICRATIETRHGNNSHNDQSSDQGHGGQQRRSGNQGPGTPPTASRSSRHSGFLSTGPFNFWGGAGQSSGGGEQTSPNPESHRRLFHENPSAGSSPNPDNSRRRIFQSTPDTPPLHYTETSGSDMSRGERDVSSGHPSPRRDSRSPPWRSAMRQRSPHQSSSREHRSEGSNNPFVWLRHVMDRPSGSSTSASGRDNRRS